MISVYLSGPITSPTPEGLRANIAKGAAMAKIIWELGPDFGVHCPHLNSDFEGAEKIPHEQYMRFDLRMLEACDVVVMVDGWAHSRGACEEHSYAMSLGIPIISGNVEARLLEMAAAQKKRRDAMTLDEALEIFDAQDLYADDSVRAEAIGVLLEIAQSPDGYITQQIPKKSADWFIQTAKDYEEATPTMERTGE